MTTTLYSHFNQSINVCAGFAVRFTLSSNSDWKSGGETKGERRFQSIDMAGSSSSSGRPWRSIIMSSPKQMNQMNELNNKEEGEESSLARVSLVQQTSKHLFSAKGQSITKEKDKNRRQSRN
jgi:hypothetical protein